jgi:predicted NBD/HSP70 family sugar kinase
MRAMRISDYEFNRMRLLKAIRRAEPVARTDLVKITGLAAGTVTQLTADLVRRRILIEGKPAQKSFGRPRVELQINAKAAHVVSVFSAAHGHHVVEIVDLRGDVVFSRTVRLAHSRSIATRAAQLARAIDRTLSAASVSRADIARIGICFHGIVDNQKGIVHWLATYPDREVPVAALIEERLRIPVVIDNSTNLIARAEHWFGEAEHVDDFSVMLIDLGLGSAHYVDGMLWSGALGINSELGHVKIVSEAGRSCYCGARGCLAAHCSVFGIVSQIAELRGESAPLETLAESFKIFAAQALAGDAATREIFKQAGAMLGTAASNILHERNPMRLIVMVFNAELIPLISDSFFAALKTHSLPAFAAKTEVQFKLIDDAAYYRKGCAVLALEQIYRGRIDASPRARKRPIKSAKPKRGRKP